MKSKIVLAIILSLIVMVPFTACDNETANEPASQQNETAETAKAESIELDELQTLFITISEEVSNIDDFNQLMDGADYYVEESGSRAKMFSIGADSQATTERTRDRIGPCIDVYFDEDGNFSSEEYGIYNDAESNYVGTVKFDSGSFVSGAGHFDNAEDAFRDFFETKKENAK